MINAMKTILRYGTKWPFVRIKKKEGLLLSKLCAGVEDNYPKDCGSKKSHSGSV